MNPSNSARDVFCRALELPVEERAAFVAKVCGDNHELCSLVGELLEAHEISGGFFDGSTFAPFDPTETRTGTESSRREQPEWAGPYKLLERIGEGGMGVVYVAEQEAVNRRVAVKLIKLGMDSKQVVARFEAERQALARMNHPHIAGIHDAGVTSDGRPYFAMEYVPGLHVNEHCDRETLTIRERLSLFLYLCEAVQHAHQKGIIHRDLKPSNVLVSVEDGRPIPKVIDFGIAKATNHRLTDQTIDTQQGTMVGTPTYMSPEQAEGAEDIDTRTDIYTLGVILYELLVGALPYELDIPNYEGVQRAIREKVTPKPSSRLEPESKETQSVARTRRVDPRTLAKELRGDLDWILLKALEKDRTRRYASVSEFAADISRYLAEEPVLARRPGVVYRVQKFVKRRRGLSAAIMGAALLIIATIVTVFLVQERARMHIERVAEHQRLEGYVSDVNTSSQRLRENNLARARRLLESQTPKPGQADLRSFEWWYLWNLTRGDDLESFRRGTPHHVVYSPDGRFLVQSGHGLFDSGAPDQVIVRDRHSLKPIKKLDVDPLDVSFNPDGSLMATCGWERGVRVWSTDTWTVVHKNDDEMSPASFSPDGRWLASGGRESVTLRETQNWQVVAQSKVRATEWNHRHTLAFSHDSKLLVVPDGARFSHVLRVPSFEKAQEVPKHSHPRACAAFSNDDRKILFGYWDGTIAVWDLDQRRIVESFPAHQAAVHQIAVDPSKAQFATASSDQTVVIWDASTYERAVRLLGHESEVWSLAYSPDGKQLASGSFDQTLRIWSAETRKDEQTVRGNLLALGALNGTSTVVTSVYPAIHFHDLARGEKSEWKFDQAEYYGIEISGSLNRMAAVHKDGSGKVDIWSVPQRKKLTTIATGLPKIGAMDFSNDDRKMAFGGSSSAVVLSLETGAELARFEVDGEVSNANFSPDGRRLAATAFVHRDMPVHVWDLEGGRELAPFPAQSAHQLDDGLFA